MPLAPAVLYEYDIDGNVVYKGTYAYADSNISLQEQGAAIWEIIQYTYDVDGNCISKLAKKGSWTLRAQGW